MKGQRILVSVFLFFVAGLLPACESSPSLEAMTERERDGLVGAVKATMTADVALMQQNGQWLENQQATSVAVYDEAGKRMSQTPFRINLPGGFAITPHDPLFRADAKNKRSEEVISNIGGKWVKDYNERGFAVRRERHDVTGKLTEAHTIDYVFDAKGNWIKRTISKLAGNEREPVEASYREIVYFHSPPVPAVELATLIRDEERNLKSPVSATDEAIDAGRTLFNQRCSVCHGENGKGESEFGARMLAKPADLTRDRTRALTSGEWFSLINNGIKTHGMPGYKGRLGEEALWQLTLYAQRLARGELRSTSTEPPSSTASAPLPTKPEPERRYNLRGKIVAVERSLRQVTIEHEEIKGYMEAMTMPFPLTDEKILNRVKPGDRIEAKLVIGIGSWRLENVVLK